MKTMFFAAAAAFLVLGGAAQAQPVQSNAQTVHLPPTVVVGEPTQTQSVADPLARENPTGLPAYLMRPDGLMINGLLPAQGWEG